MRHDGKKRPLVLVVDDGRQHVMLLRLALMQRGYAVVVATSADAARAMTSKTRADALLVTLESEAAILALRAMGDAKPKLAIALADAAEGPTLRAAGFDATLGRPVDFAELDALLAFGVFRRRSGTRAKRRASAKHKIA